MWALWYGVAFITETVTAKQMLMRCFHGASSEERSDGHTKTAVDLQAK
jgi:hypothetical protein